MMMRKDKVTTVNNTENSENDVADADSVMVGTDNIESIKNPEDDIECDNECLLEIIIVLLCAVISCNTILLRRFSYKREQVFRTYVKLYNTLYISLPVMKRGRSSAMIWGRIILRHSIKYYHC